MFRHQVEDVSFMVKNIQGKQNPPNFMSRHPAPIRELTLEEKDRHMKHEGEDITHEMIRQASDTDKYFNELKFIQPIHQGVCVV